jgi:transposase
VLQATRITLGLLARRIGQLSEQIRDVDARLARLVERHAPQLLEMVGIGPDTAVALLITVGDNPERLDSEASFATLCGTTTSVGSRRARPGAKSSVASNAMLPGRSSTWSNRYGQHPAYRGCRDR